MQHPAWAARVPVALLPEDSPEGRALISLIDAVDVGDLPGAGGMGMVLEHFRHTPHAETLARQASQSLDGEFDEGVVEVLLQDTLDKLRQTNVRQEFTRLTEKARSRGLSPEELSRYRDLLRDGKEPSRPTKVSDL
jgi:DNA primase